MQAKEINSIMGLSMTYLKRSGGARMETCKDLNEVRENIDRIDRQIVKLIAERGFYVKLAAGFKKDADGVKAPNRVEAVIEKVRGLALEYGAFPDIVEGIYRQMIHSFISKESEEFKKNQSK